MAGVRKKPLAGGQYQGYYLDARGKRCFFSGVRSRAETLRMAQRLEDDHRQIRLGYRPPPSSADRYRARDCSEAMEEYLAWGGAQGARGGKGWSPIHARARRTRLTAWQVRLGLESLGDLDGVMAQVEAAAREYAAQGQAPKTVANKVEALRAFCIWCEKRGYLATNPLKALAPFDMTPRAVRRAMTEDEIQRLLEASPADRRLLYEVALVSGLRAGELRSLSVSHLDTARGGLNLDAAWTKNRRSGFQPLPLELVGRLQAFAASGESKRLYNKNLCGRAWTAPEDPLLYVPSHPERCMGIDLKAAGIAKWTPAGKLDFHASRTAFVTLLLESEVTVKEAQQLARHSTPSLTMNTYGRARDERLASAIERVGRKVLSTAGCARSVHGLALGPQTESATPWAPEDCASFEMVAAEGIEPPTRGL